MKNKLLVVLGLFIFVAILITWFWPAKQQQPISLKEKDHFSKPAVNPALEPFVPEIEEIKQLEKTNPQKAKDRTDALVEKLPEKLQRYAWIGFKAGMLPINFYGQVVDQYGEPVSRPTITYEIGGALLASGKGIGRVVGDDQGRFEIHSEGGSLTLGTVQARGIEFQFPKPRHLKYTTLAARTTSMRFVGAQKTIGDEEPLWSDTAPDKPYIFTAWRVGKYEDVKAGGERFGFVPDGRAYTFNFSHYIRSKQFKKDGLSEGQIRVSCLREPLENNQREGDWKVMIKAVDGGIQVTNDTYRNLAPEDGYQSELTIDMRSGSPEYKARLSNQSYFFTANNGKSYGSLYLHFDPFARKDFCAIDLVYKANLNGSRNLALRPKQPEIRRAPW